MLIPIQTIYQRNKHEGTNESLSSIYSTSKELVKLTNFKGTRQLVDDTNKQFNTLNNNKCGFIEIAFIFKVSLVINDLITRKFNLLCKTFLQ